VKNGPPTFHKAMTKTFRKNMHIFMKIFLDDFIVYNDMEIHLQNFRICFQKCREYNISLNAKKYVFMVFFGAILEFIVSNEGKLIEPKKIQAIMNMLVSHNSQ
jgi:hypothetical protein